MENSNTTDLCTAQACFASLNFSKTPSSKVPVSQVESDIRDKIRDITQPTHNEALGTILILGSIKDDPNVDRFKPDIDNKVAFAWARATRNIILHPNPTEEITPPVKEAYKDLVTPIQQYLKKEMSLEELNNQANKILNDLYSQGLKKETQDSLSLNYKRQLATDATEKSKFKDAAAKISTDPLFGKSGRPQRSTSTFCEYRNRGKVAAFSVHNALDRIKVKSQDASKTESMMEKYLFLSLAITMLNDFTHERTVLFLLNHSTNAQVKLISQSIQNLIALTILKNGKKVNWLADLKISLTHKCNVENNIIKDGSAHLEQIEKGFNPILKEIQSTDYDSEEEEVKVEDLMSYLGREKKADGKTIREILRILKGKNVQKNSSLDSNKAIVKGVLNKNKIDDSHIDTVLHHIAPSLYEYAPSDNIFQRENSPTRSSVAVPAEDSDSHSEDLDDDDPKDLDNGPEGANDNDDARDPDSASGGADNDHFRSSDSDHSDEKTTNDIEQKQPSLEFSTDIPIVAIISESLQQFAAQNLNSDHSEGKNTDKKPSITQAIQVKRKKQKSAPELSTLIEEIQQSSKVPKILDCNRAYYPNINLVSRLLESKTQQDYLKDDGPSEAFNNYNTALNQYFRERDEISSVQSDTKKQVKEICTLEQ